MVVAEEARKTYRGQLDLIFGWGESSISVEERANVYRKLGHVAAILYDPIMIDAVNAVHILRHPFRIKISEDFGGNVDLWAITQIQQLFHRRRTRKLKECRHSTEALLNGMPDLYQQFKPRGPVQAGGSTLHLVFQACLRSWNSLKCDEGEANKQHILASSVAYRLGVPPAEFKYIPFNQQMIIRSW